MLIGTLPQFCLCHSAARQQLSNRGIARVQIGTQLVTGNAGDFFDLQYALGRDSMAPLLNSLVADAAFLS